MLNLYDITAIDVLGLKHYILKDKKQLLFVSKQDERFYLSAESLWKVFNIYINNEPIKLTYYKKLDLSKQLIKFWNHYKP